MLNRPFQRYCAFQPSLSYRLRHSKTLFAIAVVLGLTVMALATALVVSSSPNEVCADCGMVQSVMAVQRQAQVSDVPVGNTAENNIKQVTVYEVLVSMDDGSLRNFYIPMAVPLGSKVMVEGNNLRVASANH